jgi:hypothetical protein
MKPDTDLAEQINREHSSSATRNQRMRRIGKVFEGLFFLMFLSPTLFIVLHFHVVPLFGGRRNNPPTTLLVADGYQLGLLGYACLALTAIIRIIEGIDSRTRFRYDRLIIFLAAIGVLLLVIAVIVEIRGV